MNTMKTLLSIASTVILGMLIVIIPTYALYNTTGGGTYRLQSTVTSSQSTVALSSFKEPVSNILYTMSYLNSSIEYGTIEPQTNTKEFISFSGITQNADGTATLTGVVRGLGFSYPYTSSSTLQQAHPAQAIFILSNPPQLTNQYANKNNNEVVVGEWSGITPTASADFATKAYVDSVVGGVVTTNQLVVAATAGETITAGQPVFYQTSDSRWYKAGTGTAEASSTVLGIAQGAGTAGVAISGGALLHGIDNNQSGLTSGSNYFIANTAGTIGLATTTRTVGKARSTTSLYFDPFFLSPTLPGTNSWTGNNTFSATTTVTATSSLTVGSFSVWQVGKQSQIFTSTGTTTFSVPSGITQALVEVQGSGGGGGGGSAANSGAPGGGGGGTCIKEVNLTGTTTVQVFIGTGGIGNYGGAGNDGTWSTFGTNGFYCSAKGGDGGGNQAGVAGVGGTAAGGDLNIKGGGGGYGSGAATSNEFSGIGGSAHFGGGGSAGYPNSGSGDSGGNYGGGASGGTSTLGATAGGVGANGMVRISW
jgi:hypothetical protein